MKFPKKVSEYGCIRVGQVVRFSKQVFLPTNIFERLTIHNTSTDFFQFVGKVIDIKKLATCEQPVKNGKFPRIKGKLGAYFPPRGCGELCLMGDIGGDMV